MYVGEISCYDNNRPKELALTWKTEVSNDPKTRVGKCLLGHCLKYRRKHLPFVSLPVITPMLIRILTLH